MKVPRDNLYTELTKDFVYSDGVHIYLIVSTITNKVTYRVVAGEYREDCDNLDDAIYYFNTAILDRDKTNIIELV